MPAPSQTEAQAIIDALLTANAEQRRAERELQQARARVTGLVLQLLDAGYPAAKIARLLGVAKQTLRDRITLARQRAQAR